MQCGDMYYKLQDFRQPNKNEIIKMTFNELFTIWFHNFLNYNFDKGLFFYFEYTSIFNGSKIEKNTRKALCEPSKFGIRALVKQKHSTNLTIGTLSS